MKIGLFLVGYKGLQFLKIFDNPDVEFVVSYQDKNINDGFFDHIKKFSCESGFKFYGKKEFEEKYCDDVDIIFTIGWQYLINYKDKTKFVVLHDSYLPRLKGFCPTASTLINGGKYLGATAFRPVDSVDEGPIYLRKRIRIKYPMHIDFAFCIVAGMYKYMAYRIIRNNIKPRKVMSFKESYSIWRDTQDMFISWDWDGKRIDRFVNALGFPYSCAKTKYRGSVINVIAVEPIKRKYKFIENHCGKIWGVDQNNGDAIVLCGDGMIRIIFSEYSNGEKVKFKSIRERLG